MANIYVSPTGNDTTGDGSSGSPYKHIHHAIDQISSDGNTIICQNGTYDEEIARTINYDITIQSSSGIFSDVIIKPLTLTDANGFGIFWRIEQNVDLLIKNITFNFFESFFSSSSFVGNAIFWSNETSSLGTVIAEKCFFLGDNDSSTYTVYVGRCYFVSGSWEFYKCTIRNFGTGFRFTNITLSDNIFENCDNALHQGSYTGDYNCFYNCTTIFNSVSGGSLNTNDITSDPNFIGTSAEATIDETSPCFDAGVTVSGHITSYQGDAPDIGVYEVLLGETIDVNETINIAELNENNVSQETISVDETVNIAESNELVNNAIDVNESINIADESSSEINKIDVNESINIAETIVTSNLGTVNNASKILSYNPLIIVTDANPAKIAVVDKTDPNNPSWNIYTLSDVSNANNVAYNSITGYIYVVCDSGEVKKIHNSDILTQTLIDTIDSNNLEKIVLNEDKFKLFTSTNDSTGEIITIDESTIKNINCDLRFLQQITEQLDIQINTVSAKSIDVDMRFLGVTSKTISLDIRFLKYNYSDISANPITYEDWQIKINNTDLIPLNDIDMKSIVITHRENEESVASFRLNRRFDDLDRDHDGNSSQITNNNEVKIYIDDHLEFSGKVAQISAESETESVIVTAYGLEPTDKRYTVNLPLASVNEQLNLYHCLAESVNIDNPYIDSNDENPQYYKGVKYDRGTLIKQNVSRWTAFYSVLNKIEAGNFAPKQNWSYFWFASVKYLANGGVFGSTSTINSRYIGTSLSPISSDLLEILSAYYKYQRIYDDTETELGYSYIGSAPYLEVSGPNGELRSAIRWEDRNDGLYTVKDDYYNNLSILYKIAQLEYQKLQNINGEILPVTSASLELSIDAYYFYALKLLTRLNLTNTTIANVYKNLNGFPTSIKSITISSATMKVVLETDNQWSKKELKELDNQYPDDEDGQYQGYARLNYSKYDILSRTYVS